MAQQSLAGRTAIVTGAGKNIGRAIALALAGQGAAVVLNGLRDSDALEGVATEIRRIGGKALVARADVGDAEAVQAMVDETLKVFGGVDIAVSNVSVRLHQAFLEISIADWNRVIATNLSASFFLARAVIPHMQERGWGRIIHISGSDGFFPKANRAHNVVCKAGVHALAKAIAVEFGPYGITANTIAPGIIETVRDPANYPNAGEEYERRRQALPVRRLGKPEEIAQACLFLVSENAGYVTGQVLHINGGELMV